MCSVVFVGSQCSDHISMVIIFLWCTSDLTRHVCVCIGTPGNQDDLNATGNQDDLNATGNQDDLNAIGKLYIAPHNAL